MKLNLPFFLAAAAAAASASLEGVHASPKSSKSDKSSKKSKKSSACLVTSAADSGAGSLREALASCDSIKISSSVGTITIDSTLEYNSEDDLEIEGSGQTIQASGDFTLLLISQGADLKIEELAFVGIGGFGPRATDGNTGNGKGIFVAVPSTAKGTVKVELEDVTVMDVAYHGIHIRDCPDDDCGAGSGGGGLLGSDASIEVKLKDVTVENVGRGRLDGDGLRVDERGPGDIKFECKGGNFTNVGADGIELDEGGPGDVIAKIEDSVITFNGDWCTDTIDFGCDNDGDPDVDDGFDIDEEDEGSLYLTAKNVIISNNADEGFDIDEAGPGDISAYFEKVTANANKDEGIKCSEEDDGDLKVTVTSSTVNDSLDNDGMQFESEGNGRTDVVIKGTEATGNDGEDLKVEQEDDVELGTLEIRDGSVIDVVETDNVKFV